MLKNTAAPMALVALFCSVLTASGCARLSIPAPAAPIAPMAEPAVPDSTITVPVAIEIPPVAAAPGGENALAGAIRDFLGRQAAKLANNDAVRDLFLRQQLGKAWDAIQAPLALTNGVSLLLDPQALALAPLEGTGNKAGVVVNITARPRIVAGAAPPRIAGRLPSFSISTAVADRGFHIALATELSFEYLGKELTKKLTGASSRIRGEYISVEKVRVSGSENSIVLAVSIKGTVKGTVYLTGTPVYDESTRSLAVRNVEYTLETKQVLAKLADWMLHSGLRDSLAERASWSVGERIDAAREQLTRALNRELNPHVSVLGEIRTLAPSAVGLTPTSIRAVLLADGAVEVNVH